MMSLYIHCINSCINILSSVMWHGSTIPVGTPGWKAGASWHHQTLTRSWLLIAQTVVLMCLSRSLLYTEKDPGRTCSYKTWTRIKTRTVCLLRSLTVPSSSLTLLWIHSWLYQLLDKHSQLVFWFLSFSTHYQITCLFAKPTGTFCHLIARVFAIISLFQYAKKSLAISRLFMC